MEKTKDGIWIIDANGNTLYASQSMADILKTTLADLIGQSSFAYVFPEDVSTAQILFESKRGGDLDQFRFRLRCKDESSVQVKVQGTPMHAPDGTFTGIVGTFTPISHAEN